MLQKFELVMNAFKFNIKKLILRMWLVKKLYISLEKVCYTLLDKILISTS